MQEKIILMIFIAINFTLYFFSYDGATFKEGADAAQYYVPALSFIEHGEFTGSKGEPFTSGTPLYSMFLAIPISIFGIDSASSVIVFMQSIMLYLTGFLSRQILLQFTNKFGLILHALIVFNPNSLITAHLVQSETLFTFLFIWSVVIASKIINNFSLKNMILLGVLTGLAALTRPVAFYLLIIWPIFILIALIIRARLNVNGQTVLYRKIQWAKLLIIVLIGAVVISPWYIRNYIKFDEVFFTSNSGYYLKDQYHQLKNKGSGWSVPDAIQEHERIYLNYLSEKNEGNFCFENEGHWSCNSVLTKVTLKAIIDEPLSSHTKALIDSWGTLFFSGGASNIRNYLGFDGKGIIVNFQNNAFNGLDSIFKLIRDMNFSYLIIFIFTTAFSTISRLIGAAGVFYLFKNRKWRPHGILLIEVIFLFTAAYLYLGQSRFRVPLEPLLMLFTVIGILYLIKKNIDKY